MTSPPSRAVLIVEDSEDLREAMVEMLTLHGHTVHARADGESAAAFVEALEGDAGCLMLLDLGLPRLRGAQVLERLGQREIPGGLKVILTTGQLVDEAFFMLPNVVAVMRKPFDLKTLLETVARFL